MTSEQAKALGTAIGRVISFLIDIGVATIFGHHFHSGLVGFVLFMVLSGLSTTNHRLIDLKEKH